MEKRKINKEIFRSFGLSFLLLTTFSLKQIEAGGHRGAISAIFHEKDERKNYSEHFYVSKENGETHWRNFQEQEPLDRSKPFAIYEIKEAQTLSHRVHTNGDREEAKFQSGPVRDLNR